MATITGTSNNDTLNGTTGDDVIHGGAGNDSITGGSGNDSLYGDAGNDTIDGGPGADTYFFNRGDGRDVIYSSGGLVSSSADHLKLGAGISIADVDTALDTVAGTLTLTFKGTRDSIVVQNYTSSAADAGKLKIDFADGTTWDAAAIAHNNSTDSDFYQGTTGNDFHEGGAGSDVLFGDAGNDTLYGDAGNDVLIGDLGANTYLFGLGDGQDSISPLTADSSANQSDTLQFGYGISLADLNVYRSGDDLVMQIRGTNDGVTMLNVMTDLTTYNVSVKFADGTGLDTAAILRMIQPSNDNYVGTSGNDVYEGGAGNDTISGGAGNDSLHGGAGNDSIDGGAGADTFYFGIGDGRDTIVANSADSAGDQLLMSSAINEADVDVRNSGGDLLLTLRDSLDSVRLQGYVGQTAANRPVIRFTDGMVWDSAAIDRKLATSGQAIAGTSGDDMLDGTLLNDTITGGAGNDTLYGDAGRDFMDGGAGADTYVFGRGDGQDTVVAGVAASPGNVDSVRLGHGIYMPDVDVSKSGNDLLLALKGSSDTVRVQGYYSLGASDRTRIDFADGTSWDSATIDRLTASTAVTLTGTANNGVLVGGQGNDTLTGGDGNDTLYGDAGNDVLAPGGGTNTTYFGYGDGQDTLNARTDVVHTEYIQFAGNISMADVDTLQDGNDLVLKLHGSNDSLRVTGYYSDPQTYQLTLRFADGYWDIDAIQNKSQATDNAFDGSDGNDMLAFGMGQDTIYGEAGDDTLYGDEGNDSLDGGAGADTFIFGKGDGRDVVVVNDADSPGDKLRLSSDMEVSNTDLTQDGNDLVVSLHGTQDSVRLQGYFSTAQANRPLIRFGDGYVMDGAGVDHRLTGTGGSIAATAGDDWIDGTVGNDTLTGGAGNDTLYGDAGADLLDGGDGNDTYLFGRGDGHDTVVASTAAGMGDKLRLGHGISMADVDVSTSGNDLLLTVNGAKDRDSVLIQNYFLAAAADRTKIEFADGGFLDAATVDRARTATADTLTGTAGNDILDGGLGNDSISGGAGNDTLYGDAGNDTLDGGAGNDTYYFGVGDGVDHIAAPATTADRKGDVLQFGAGITLADVDITNSNGSLLLSLHNGVDKVYIDNYFSDAATDRMAVRFADGSQLLGPDIDATMTGTDDGNWGTPADDTLDGGDGNDVMAGMDGMDTLYGDSGNDWMDGGLGADTYYFGKGDGHDTILADANSDVAGTQDRLILGADVAPGDLSVTRNGSDLLLKVTANDDVLIKGYFDRAQSDRLSIQFANGWAWDGATVNRKVDPTATGFANWDTLQGTAGEDLIDGGTGSDSISGLAGDDYLVGDVGDDTLDGGAGIDTMVGGPGNDVYVVDNPGDVVIEQANQGTDQVQIGYDAGPGGYTIGANVENAKVLTGFNTSVTGNKLQNNIVGGSGNDYLFGGFGADRLTGGAGNDTLEGGVGSDRMVGSTGSDTYEITRGDGFDVILNYDTNPADFDTVDFSGVDPTQLWFSRDDNDLKVTVIGEIASTVWITNWYTDPAYQVDQFKLADSGKTLSASKVQGLVDAMAAFSEPQDTTLPANYAQALNSVITTSWS